jgi:hypothetical protein
MKYNKKAKYIYITILIAINGLLILTYKPIEKLEFPIAEICIKIFMHMIFTWGLLLIYLDKHSSVNYDNKGNRINRQMIKDCIEQSKIDKESCFNNK